MLLSSGRCWGEYYVIEVLRLVRAPAVYEMSTQPGPLLLSLCS